MKISLQFSRFFHGVVLKQIWDQNIELVITISIKDKPSLTRRLNPRGIWRSMDEMKQFLKILDESYPFGKNNNRPYSIKFIETDQLLHHIEWVLSICSDTPQFVQDEWDNLKLQAGISS